MYLGSSLERLSRNLPPNTGKPLLKNDKLWRPHRPWFLATGVKKIGNFRKIQRYKSRKFIAQNTLREWLQYDDDSHRNHSTLLLMPNADESLYGLRQSKTPHRQQNETAQK